MNFEHVLAISGGVQGNVSVLESWYPGVSNATTFLPLLPWMFANFVEARLDIPLIRLGIRLAHLKSRRIYLLEFCLFSKGWSETDRDIKLMCIFSCHSSSLLTVGIAGCKSRWKNNLMTKWRSKSLFCVRLWPSNIFSNRDVLYNWPFSIHRSSAVPQCLVLRRVVGSGVWWPWCRC
jgi:hypothetical protein